MTWSVFLLIFLGVGMSSEINSLIDTPVYFKGKRLKEVMLDDYLQDRFMDKWGRSVWVRLRSALNVYLREGSSRALYLALRSFLGPDKSSMRQIHPHFVMCFSFDGELVELCFDASDLLVTFRVGRGRELRYSCSALSDSWIGMLPVVSGMDRPFCH